MRSRRRDCAMLFLSEATALAIRSLDEHWDGRGMPDGLRGEEIPLAARILCLAQTVEVFHTDGGVKAARAMAKRRAAAGSIPRWWTPSCVSAMTGSSGRRSSLQTSPNEATGLRACCDDARLDRIAEAFAKVINANRRSQHVTRARQQRSLMGLPRCSALTRTSGELCDAPTVRTTSASSRSPTLLDKPERLTDEEFQVVKTHPMHALRILSVLPVSRRWRTGRQPSRSWTAVAIRGRSVPKT